MAVFVQNVVSLVSLLWQCLTNQVQFCAVTFCKHKLWLEHYKVNKWPELRYFVSQLYRAAVELYWRKW